MKPFEFLVHSVTGKVISMQGTVREELPLIQRRMRFSHGICLCWNEIFGRMGIRAVRREQLCLFLEKMHKIVCKYDTIVNYDNQVNGFLIKGMGRSSVK